MTDSKEKKCFMHFFPDSKRDSTKWKFDVRSALVIRLMSGCSNVCHRIKHHHQYFIVERTALSSKTPLNFVKSLA